MEKSFQIFSLNQLLRTAPLPTDPTAGRDWEAEAGGISLLGSPPSELLGAAGTGNEATKSPAFLDLSEAERAGAALGEATPRKILETTPMTEVSFDLEKFPPNEESSQCKCKKSQCLRLHCACFTGNQHCGPQCECADCMNQPEFEDARQFVIQKTMEINPLAFKSKVRQIDASQREINIQGCKCRRNGCRKNYCECFKRGVGCSSVCRCSACQNAKEALGAAEEAEVGQRIFRKKHKIIISQKMHAGEANGCFRAITFVPHSKKIKKSDTGF